MLFWLASSGKTIGKRKNGLFIMPILYNAHFGITGFGSINSAEDGGASAGP